MVKRFILFILFIFPVIFLKAQFKKLDLQEIMQVIDKSENDIVKCDTAAYFAVRLYRNMQPQESRQVLLKIIPVAQATSYDKIQPRLFFNLNQAEEALKNYPAAVAAGHTVLALVKNEKEKLHGDILSNLCRNYIRAGKVDSAIKYYQLTKTRNDKYEPYRNWILYTQMSELYEKQGNLIKAEEFLKNAYSITKPKNLSTEHGVVVFRLRQVVAKKKDVKAYALYTEEYQSFTSGRTHGLEIGAFKDDKDAIRKYEALLVQFKKMNFKDGVTKSLASLASLHLKTKEPQKALEYLGKMDTAGMSDQTKAVYYESLKEVNKQNGDYKSSLDATIKMLAIKDTLQNESLQKLTMELEKKYETEAKDKEITFLQKEDQMKSVLLSKEKSEKNKLLKASALLLCLLSVIGYLFYQNQRKGKKLALLNTDLKKAVADKDLLLREIHHRVKNNLQVVSSLLNLQANYITDEAALEAITEGKNRVGSMALIHQNLYTQENLTSINTGVYFDELIEQIEDTYNLDSSGIVFHKEIDSEDLDVDVMIPIGLISNELLSNAHKHAFPGGRKGNIYFTFKRRENDYLLSVKDDGAGMLPDSFLTAKSFGNKMIQTFAEKIGATLEIDGSNGANFILLIPRRIVTKAIA
jgi:two-component sensor histidine kinase